MKISKAVQRRRTVGRAMAANASAGRVGAVFDAVGRAIVRGRQVNRHRLRALPGRQVVKAHGMPKCHRAHRAPRGLDHRVPAKVRVVSQKPVGVPRGSRVVRQGGTASGPGAVNVTEIVRQATEQGTAHRAGRAPKVRRKKTTILVIAHRATVTANLALPVEVRGRGIPIALPPVVGVPVTANAMTILVTGHREPARRSRRAADRPGQSMTTGAIE